jgi:hypothetical protein
VVTALDKDDQFVNFLELSAALVGPAMDSTPLELKQTAPGRYIGRAPITNPGSYFLSVSAGSGQAPVRAGVNVPYSAEFKDRQTNEPLLRNLAALAPQGGKPGLVVAEPSGELDASLAANVFRHDLEAATSRQDSWHWLAFLAGCLFLLDVFNRRVMVSFAWVKPLAGRLGGYVLGRRSAVEVEKSLERLAAKKSQLDREFEDRRAAARYEPELPVGAAASDEAVLVDSTVDSHPAREPRQPSLAPQAEAEGYTARLLKAKQRVWHDRNRPDERE